MCVNILTLCMHKLKLSHTHRITDISYIDLSFIHIKLGANKEAMTLSKYSIDHVE